MAGIDIEVSIRENVIAALNRLAAAGADLTPAMKDIAEGLVNTTQDRFDEGRAPDGTRWKPSLRVLGLDGSRDRRGYGPHQMVDKTLIASGDLYSSIKSDWGADYAAAGPENSAGAAIYAMIHQFGGTIKPKAGRKGRDGHSPALSFGGRHLASITVPARPYLGFTDEDADNAMRSLMDHVAKSLGGAS